MNPVLPSTADHLLMVLPFKAEAALTYAQLAQRLYGTPVEPLGDATTARKRRTAIRKCQEAVEALRDRGEAICGGDQGMWLTRDGDEAMTEYRRLRSRALGQIRRASSMKATAFRMKAGSVEQLPLGWVA